MWGKLMLRSSRGADLQCRSPATDNLQIGGHDAVQVSSVTLTNKSTHHLSKKDIRLYNTTWNECWFTLILCRNKGFLHLLTADGGHWDPGGLWHGALHGDGDVAGSFMGQSEMPLSWGWSDYTASDRSLQSRLRERKGINHESEKPF